jgi:hypothetical protein
LNTRLDKVDLVVSESRHDRGRFVDDSPGDDVEKRIDLALHPEQLLLSQAFRDCGVDCRNQHVDLAAERRRSGCNGPVDRGTCCSSLRFVEIELRCDLPGDPPGAYVLKEPRATDRHQKEDGQSEKRKALRTRAGSRGHERVRSEQRTQWIVGPAHPSRNASAQCLAQ